MKLGRYEVVRELGKGAMGIVYLAKDPLIGRLVALKTIRAAAHADDDETREFQQRFIREAQAAGILNHPSIVTVHDIGQDDTTNMSFIAMEFVEGQNLKEVLAQGRAMTFDQIGDIVAQVAEALDFAHAKGIVHRDVKPANIILIDGMRAKITDFGIAKIASGGANLTSTGQFLGTPNYMAPEQIKGAPVDGRTDIFALGICLYEMLTRRKPFGGDSLTSISYKIVHEPFPPLGEINPQIPEGYEEVVAHCLAKDPSKRYQRARDLANAVRTVIRGEKPVRMPEPLLADETVVTRDREKLPTLEMPFPEAEMPPVQEAGTNPVASTPAASAAAAPATQATKRPAAAPMQQRLRKTLTDVRAYPAWRRPISPAIFVGIVALLAAGLIALVVAARTHQAVEPRVDRQAEMRAARERQLRNEGNALLRQGRMTDAYAKFEELNRMSPGSPFVTSLLQKLSVIRVQQETNRQQAELAKAKIVEGQALLAQKKFDDAIARFTEATTLDPTSLDAQMQLRAAQDQKTAALASRQQRPRASQVATTPGGPATAIGGNGSAPATPAQPAATGPAKLTTVFNSPFSDGYIMVKAGSETVAHENLWTEGGRFFKRKQPRVVNVTRDFTPKNADLQIWVIVPSQRIQEHHTVTGASFAAGSAQTLQVRYDAASKKFSYELQ